MKTDLTRTALLLALTVTVGCQPPRPPAPKAVAVVADDPVALIRDDLRKSDDAGLNRRLLDQWNTAFTDADRPAVTDVTPLLEPLGLTPAEVVELRRPTFTPLDAEYLSEAKFFREIATGLAVDDRPPADRAAAALDWTARHVRLIARDGPADPPNWVVERGSGGPVERLLVFAALARQLDLTPALIGDPTGDVAGCWAVAVLLGESLAVFDPRLGMRLPGSLTELRADPAKLASLTVDAKIPYDASPDRVRAAALYPAVPVSALSARMAFLQAKLGAGSPKLAVDWPAEAAALGKAAFDAPRKRWSPDKPGSPQRVLAEALPTDDGGADAAPQGQRRRDRFRFELVPWQALPREVLEVPPPLGSRLQAYFAALTGIHHRPGLAQQIRQRQQYLESLREGTRELARDLRQQLVNNMMTEFDRGGTEQTGPTLVRLVATGRSDEATEVLVKLGDDLRLLRDRAAKAMPALADVRKWAEAAKSATAEYLRAQRSNDPAVVTAAINRLEEVGQASQVAAQYVQASAPEPMLAEIHFLTALCKHDQAARRQRRPGATAEATAAAWRTAEAAWSRYLTQHANAAGVPHAKLQLARAKAAGGADAREAFRAAAADALVPVEKVAALVAAR